MSILFNSILPIDIQHNAYGRHSVKTFACADLLFANSRLFRFVFPYPFKTSVLWGPQLSLCCLSTFNTMPMADIKTKRDVEPAEMNGNGKPVGGIEPDTTAMFKIT